LFVAIALRETPQSEKPELTVWGARASKKITNQYPKPIRKLIRPRFGAIMFHYHVPKHQDPLQLCSARDGG
jgi:hypothetical protein